MAAAEDDWKVDRPVTSDEEAGKPMLDREAWGSRISLIVKANISDNSGRCRTRGEIVVLYYIIKLRDIP
jgi:hypothetical protein